MRQQNKRTILRLIAMMLALCALLPGICDNIRADALPEKETAPVPITIPATTITPMLAKGTTTVPDGNYVQIEGKYFAVTNTSDLVNADFALLEWHAQGNNDVEGNVLVSAYFDGETFSRYEAVYAKVYNLLLNAPETTHLTNGQNLFANGTTGKLYIFAVSGMVNFGKRMTLGAGQRVLVLAEDDTAKIRVYYSSGGEVPRLELKADATAKEQPAIAFQGLSDTQELPITWSGKPRKDNVFELRSGSIYFNYCNISKFQFRSGNNESDSAANYSFLVLPSGYNRKRMVYMSNSVMTELLAQEAPGIFCKAYYNSTSSTANTYNEQSRLFLYNNSFTHCVSTGGDSSAYGGAAIRSYAADQCRLQAVKCKFEYNRSDTIGNASGGGAIYWKSVPGKATLIGCEFRYNSAQAVGGAIYNTGEMDIIGCTFEENYAKKGGGAIAVEPPYTTSVYTSLSGIEMTGSLELDAATILQNNRTDGNGGGIYFNAYASQIGSEYNSEGKYQTGRFDIEEYEMTLEINGAQLLGNKAKGNGGAIAMWLNYEDRSYTSGITIRNNSVIRGNIAGYISDDTDEIGNGDGGAIWMNSAESCECRAELNGGVVMETGTVSGNKAQNGGAIYVETGNPAMAMDFTMQGGTIGGDKTGNTAVNGGAVYVNGGNATISGGTVSHNRVSANGGAIYVNSGNVTLSNGAISHNNASNSGGGTFVNGGNVFVSGGEITDNTAQVNGGGVAVNNGAYKMTGGAVDTNTATTGCGGGIYVASSGVAALVEIRSGSVSGNKAGISGGAVAVIGQDGGDEEITVTVGVNNRHYDESGNEIPCEHDYDVGDPVVAACPVLRDNYATQTGGGVYITGGAKTMLNTYCLEESGSSAADGNALSNFMMVEGGTVVISTADPSYNGDGHGKITINNTIHVYAGEMDLYGSMSNPLLLGAITVDVTEERGSYTDHRTSDEKYYKLQYFENFLAPGAEKPTGRYTVFQIKHGETHEILPALYQHDGYVIDGWWTDELGDVAGSVEYLINKSYTFVGESAEKPGDLTLYAKWLPVGYYVYFDVGTTDPHRGEMENVRYNYDTENTLPANAFFRPGWLFAGWDYDGAGDAPLLKDMATVKNLTTERDITLVAVWNLCTHEEEQFTYSVAGNSLVRNCYCEKCTQTAMIMAEDTVFVDGIPYVAEIKIVTNATNGAQPGNWNPEPTYTGAKYNGNAFEPEEFLIGAGRYTVSITAGGQTATVNFEIKKAEQSPPAEPKFESFETNQTIEEGKIKIIDPQDTTGGKLRYKIIWHDDAGTPHEKVADLHTATTAGFVLDTNYTNYYVYVQYEADDNHNESVWVRARSVLFYEGNVYIFIDCEDGIDYETKGDETHRGLIILVSANSGYYLYDIKVEDNHPDTHIGDPTTEDGKLRYYISGIPKSDETPIRIDLTISGVKKAVVISGALTEGEAFGTVQGNSAVITRDSAYTAYFEVKNYDVYTNPKLHFSTALPENTTVILVDKTTGIPVYWSTTLENASTEIPLSALVRMGTVDDAFTLPQNTTELVLKYQVIVDFSDSAGCSGETLTTKFTAERSADAEAKGAPVFPECSLVTEPKDAAFSSLNVSDSTDTMQKNLQIEFLRVSTGTVASKWNGRRVALVLTPTASLPGDAHIEVVDQTGMKTQYYRNADGKYIVSLTDVQRDTLRLTLLSQLFPDGKTEYTFRAELICASSLAGESPLNGISLIEAQDITFVKETKLPEPSLKIEGDKRVYDVGDTVKVTVNYKNLPEHTALVLRLLSKDTSPNSSGNTYIDSGWKQQQDTVFGENTVPLGQNLTGSCCVVLELRDIMGNVIASVPYYFVIKE